ncbi:2-hydroxyacyl-CoA dehydratase family protein [Steroidobacter cummioxidans]|uniref:2-hydroxyacyl-CoA dehydratase family protein n=1 Tax=Steroidobacter cummioxidans TaxID=1803913 RepID=UPI0013799DA3|nr:2-hydroxyacyl-CoA dehydratase family protein [Steroidobacter cummioxidans]
MSLSTLLNSALSDPLHAARSQRAIGLLGWNVPVELLLAADAVPVQLNALPHSDHTVLADRYLEPSFSAQSRVVADRWLAGDLDGLEAVIFSRSDDSAQRLYYYLCELQRVGECKGPEPLLYDLARIRRETSLAHTIESTRALATAVRADESRLMAEIERVVARERLLGELTKLRVGDAVPLGCDAYRIVRGARTQWSTELDESLQQWLSGPATVEPRKRVLLVGSVPSDDHVHHAIESDGVVVVGEINEASSPASLPASAVTTRYVSLSNPVETIARRCYDQTNAIGTLLQSPADLVKAARALRVDGVIVWMLATDTGLAWEAPQMERALREAALPTLMLTSQPQTLSNEALTLIAQFRRALEVR